MSRQTAPIGALSTRLALEAPQNTPDAGGGVATTWSEVETIWAELAPASAAERVRADHLETAITHKIVLRHRVEIDGTYRFRLGDRLFRIRAVYDPDEAGRFLVALVEEERR